MQALDLGQQRQPPRFLEGLRYYRDILIREADQLRQRQQEEAPVHQIEHHHLQINHQLGPVHGHSAQDKRWPQPQQQHAGDQQQPWRPPPTADACWQERRQQWVERGGARTPEPNEQQRWAHPDAAAAAWQQQRQQPGARGPDMHGRLREAPNEQHQEALFEAQMQPSPAQLLGPGQRWRTPPRNPVQALLEQAPGGQPPLQDVSNLLHESSRSPWDSRNGGCRVAAAAEVSSSVPEAAAGLWQQQKQQQQQQQKRPLPHHHEPGCLEWGEPQPNTKRLATAIQEQQGPPGQGFGQPWPDPGAGGHAGRQDQQQLQRPAAGMPPPDAHCRHPPRAPTSAGQLLRGGSAPPQPWDQVRRGREQGAAAAAGAWPWQRGEQAPAVQQPHLRSPAPSPPPTAWQQQQQQCGTTGPLQPRRHQRVAPSRPAARPRGAQLLQRLAQAAGGDGEDAAQGGGGGGGGGAPPAAAKRWPWLAAERRDAGGRRPGEPGYDPGTLLVPAAALAAMSEFGRQFWSIKARCFDLVLFVRHGSFFNLFDVDADVGLRVGLNLSGPATSNMWKVGCHKDYFAVWCSKVLAQGYSVGRVEEMPQAPGARGLLSRRLVQIYTPGTAVEGGLLAEDAAHQRRPFICLAELPLDLGGSSGGGGGGGGGGPQASGGTALGVCLVDAASGCAWAGSISTAWGTARSGLAAALLMHAPVECVAVRHNLRAATLALVRRHYDAHGTAGWAATALGGAGDAGACGHAAAGLSWLPPSFAGVLRAPHQLLAQALPGAALERLQGMVAGAGAGAGGALALATLAAVAVAVRQLQRCCVADQVLPSLSLELQVDGLAGGPVLPPGGGGGAPGRPMLLDDKAVVSLDLLAPSSSSGGGVGIGAWAARQAEAPGAPPGSLLRLLDRAATPAGRRKLREWICRPLTLASAIEERQDVVGLFLDLPHAAAALQQQLACLPDAERLLPKAACALRSLAQHGAPSRESGGSELLDGGADVCAADPAAGGQEASRAAWRALLALPGCLVNLIEAVALLRKTCQQAGRPTISLPLLHRAVLAAARAVQPATALSRLLDGAEWAEPAGGAGAAGEHQAAVQLAPGADEACDRARERLHAAQEELSLELQDVLAAYGGGGGSSGGGGGAGAGSRFGPGPLRVQRAFLGGEQEGTVRLVVEPPAGLRHGGLPKQLQLQEWAAGLLLDPAHALVGQEWLGDDEAAARAAAADGGVGSAAAAAGGGGGGGHGRRQGRGRRGGGQAAAAAAAAGAERLAVLHVLVPELRRLAGEASAARLQLAEASSAALGRAAATLRESYGLFLAAVGAAAELDVVAGFAQVAAPGSGAAPAGCCFCRPRFASASPAAAVAAAAAAAAEGEERRRPGRAAAPVLQLEGLWHPLMRAGAAGGGRVVCNDLLLGGTEPGAMVLTGANMGGKSTLLRSACLAVLMAQIGCWVPARAALVDPVDAIYTRIGAADAIMSGHSTFFVEMAETAACLRSATPASLVVLDELGRGTSTHDGQAVAFAVLRHLASAGRHCARPRLLFATHYHGLAAEPELRGHVGAWHMASIRGERGAVRHLYELRPGVAPTGSCGIEVAALAGLPESVVARAEQVSAAAAAARRQ